MALSTSYYQIAAGNIEYRLRYEQILGTLGFQDVVPEHDMCTATASRVLYHLNEATCEWRAMAESRVKTIPPVAKALKEDIQRFHSSRPIDQFRLAVKVHYCYGAQDSFEVLEGSSFERYKLEPEQDEKTGEFTTNKIKLGIGAQLENPTVDVWILEIIIDSEPYLNPPTTPVYSEKKCQEWLSMMLQGLKVSWIVPDKLLTTDAAFEDWLGKKKTDADYDAYVDKHSADFVIFPLPDAPIKDSPCIGKMMTPEEEEKCPCLKHKFFKPLKALGHWYYEMAKEKEASLTPEHKAFMSENEIQNYVDLIKMQTYLKVPTLFESEDPVDQQTKKGVYFQLMAMPGKLDSESLYLTDQAEKKKAEQEAERQPRRDEKKKGKKGKGVGKKQAKESKEEEKVTDVIDDLEKMTLSKEDLRYLFEAQIVNTYEIKKQQNPKASEQQIKMANKLEKLKNERAPKEVKVMRKEAKKEQLQKMNKDTEMKE